MFLMNGNSFMATLLIENLPDAVHNVLHEWAMQDGLTVEAEACRILSQLTAKRQSATGLQDLIAELYQGKNNVSQVEQLLQERRAEAEHE